MENVYQISVDVTYSNGLKHIIDPFDLTQKRFNMKLIPLCLLLFLSQNVLNYINLVLHIVKTCKTIKLLSSHKTVLAIRENNICEINDKNLKIHESNKMISTQI